VSAIALGLLYFISASNRHRGHTLY